MDAVFYVVLVCSLGSEHERFVVRARSADEAASIALHHATPGCRVLNSIRIDNIETIKELRL